MAIKLLRVDVVNQISAGEVVEKPASIVKELVENSIDAGATAISIEIEKGGIDRVCITDNGCGINKDEVILAFTPHATSKLEKITDLYSLETMGFRGEALATISAVSKVALITKTEQDDSAIMVNLEGGVEVGRSEVASVTGTKIDVRELFYNTPARLKFLRKPKSEENDITNYVEKLMLSHSEISFKYIVDGKLIYNTLGGSIMDVIYTIYGTETAKNVIEVDYTIGGYSLKGYVSKPEFAKANRTYQNLFVNSRFCNNALVSTAVSTAYENFTMKGKFPLYVLFLQLPQNEVDVNVHPNKLEVKFVNTKKIFQLCQDGVFKALSDFCHIKSFDDDLEEIEDESSNVTYAQIAADEGVSFSQTSETIINSAKYLTQDNNSVQVELDAQTKRISDFINNSYNSEEVCRFEDGGNILIPKQVTISSDDKLEKEYVSIQQKTEIVQQDYSALFDDEYVVIGKVFNTYLILQQNDKIYFIDQHAAHERQKYDDLIKEVENNTLQIQNLLIPYTFNVSLEENSFLQENLDLLRGFGIEMYEFGENCFKVSSVPLILADIDLKKFFEQLLENTYGYAKSPKEIIKEKFMQMACKSAVKGGDDLKEIEIKALLKRLKEETKVLLCPHGRPIVIEFTKKQIEKWFKRIV